MKTYLILSACFASAIAAQSFAGGSPTKPKPLKPSVVTLSPQVSAPKPSSPTIHAPIGSAPGQALNTNPAANKKNGGSQGTSTAQGRDGCIAGQTSAWCQPASIFNQYIPEANRQIDGYAGSRVQRNSQNTFNNSLQNGQNAFGASNQAAVEGYKSTERQETIATTRKIGNAMIAGGMAMKINQDNKKLQAALAAAQKEELSNKERYDLYRDRIREHNRLNPTRPQRLQTYKEFSAAMDGKNGNFFGTALKDLETAFAQGQSKAYLQKKFKGLCDDATSQACIQAVNRAIQVNSNVAATSGMVALGQTQESLMHMQAQSDTRTLRKGFENQLQQQQGQNYDWGSNDPSGGGTIGGGPRTSDGYNDPVVQDAADNLSGEENTISGTETGIDPYGTPNDLGLKPDPVSLGQNASGGGAAGGGGLGGGGGGGLGKDESEHDAQAKAMGGKGTSLALGSMPKAASGALLNGGGNGAGGGFDLQGMLASLMGGAKQEEFPANGMAGDITDYGGRAPANEPSLLSKEVNIFERISVAHQRKHDEGAIQ